MQTGNVLDAVPLVTMQVFRRGLPIYLGGSIASIQILRSYKSAVIVSRAFGCSSFFNIMSARIDSKPHYKKETKLYTNSAVIKDIQISTLYSADVF